MILVTGGTGLVGSHLLIKLVERGEDVIAIYRTKEKLEYVKKIFGYYTDKPLDVFNKIQWEECDLLDVFKLEEIVEQVQVIYHCAAIVSFKSSDKDKVLKTNTEGTANIVNLALEKHIDKLCFVSSIGALGRNNSDVVGEINEDVHFNKNNRSSVYSLSKHLSEQEVWRGIAEGLNAVIVNPSIILGPSDWSSGSSQLILKSWQGLKFYTKGVNGYVDVRDVVNIMIQLTNSEINAERFIISAENISYKDFFDTVAENLNKPKPSIKVGKCISEIAWRIELIRTTMLGGNPLITKETARTANTVYQYSNHKVTKSLNYKFIPISQTIKDTCKIFLSQQ
ncbi:MAG: hypothetical protein A2X12_04955 [Bacteroidetes bacterium GWE2_29_8]|nr:MAG: hypothetical protein A2X12_04955 [Bacteroidetes bacterium GWE2_29_8]